MSDPNCLFCKIATRELPADILRESDRVVAFRDVDPKAPTHILVIPKEHIGSLDAIRDAHAGLLADIVQAAAHLARTEGIDRSGWRLVSNVGRDAGQAVFHLHFHVLGGRPMGWPPG
jgi:histidine triad (HIT) family protein